MDMYSVVKENPILAILRNIPLEYTIDYAQAIVDGGISFFEVALNSEHGLKQIAILRDHFGEKCMIGAGTAISVDLAKAAIGAGAQFLLTPGTPIDVLQYCAKKDIMLLPGVFTPGDVATSLEFGYKTGQIVIGDAFFRLCLYEIRDIGEHAVDNRDTVHRLFRKSPDDFDPYTAAALHGHRANKLIRRFAMFQSRFDEFPHGFIDVGKG